MKLSEGRGIKTGQWNSNEILHGDDINGLHQFAYQNQTDILSLLAKNIASGSGKPDVVVSGLLLEWDTAMTCDLRVGAAVSFTGAYFLDGVWGFNAVAGDLFSVSIGDDTSIAFAVGGGQDRIDSLEIRPIQTDYESKLRRYKDPILGSISSAMTDTRLEYGYETQILEGTPGGSPVAPSGTAGWSKLAEVYILASATDIDQDDIKDVRSSDLWTAETSETILLVMSSRVVNHITMPAGQFKLIGAKPAVIGSEGIFITLDFVHTAEKEAYSKGFVPYRWDSDTDLAVRIDWLCDADATGGDVVWGIEYIAIKDNEQVAGSTVTVTEAFTGAGAGLMQRSLFTTRILKANIASDDILGIRIFRDHDAGGDTLDQTARLLALHLHFKRDKMGQPL